MKTQHIVNISGGKDSTACYLLALRRGRPFRAVMADTGNEHPLTIEYAASLHERTGGPQVEFVRADFTDRIAAKRSYVEKHWPEKGVPMNIVNQAIEALRPTGNPFLDLVLWKGRFPSRLAQFCTEFLKQEAVEQQVVGPAARQGPVIQWLGVRRDESLHRRNAPRVQVVRRRGRHDMRLYRPIVDWNAWAVFDLARAHGLPPNPLYLHGMGRVGCFPCINANKAEIRAIATRFPEAIERIAEWERLAGLASKRGAATFFAPGKTPASRAISKSLDGIDNPTDRAAAKNAAQWPTAHDVAAWSVSGRDGRQTVLDLNDDDGISCTSQYGLCE